MVLNLFMYMYMYQQSHIPDNTLVSTFVLEHPVNATDASMDITISFPVYVCVFVCVCVCVCVYACVKEREYEESGGVYRPPCV